MRTKEIAERLQVTPRTIRFYEKKGLIQPKKSPDNDYREFTEQDAWRLQMIISLREVGMMLDDIKEILNQLDEGSSHHEVLKLLDFQRFMLFSQWSELKQQLQTMDQMITVLEQKRSLAWEDIFALADGSKRLRDVRKNWVDQWDFDQQAAVHDQLVFDTTQEFSFHPHYEQALQRIVLFINPLAGESGLDIGAGTGNLAHLFTQHNVKMTAIDQSQKMLGKCKAKNPAIQSKLGNFLAIPFMDQSFDFIVTSYAFHTLNKEQKPVAINEMLRVLKPGGRMVLLDIMFVNEMDQNMFMNQLEKQSKPHIIERMRKAYYAYTDQLIEQFCVLGLHTQTVQLDRMLHLIYVEQKQMD